MTASYSPDAIKTWANAVTVARIMVSPILFVMITGDQGSWPSLARWIILCARDGIDDCEPNVCRRRGLLERRAP